MHLIGIIFNLKTHIMLCPLLFWMYANISFSHADMTTGISNLPQTASTKYVVFLAHVVFNLSQGCMKKLYALQPSGMNQYLIGAK